GPRRRASARRRCWSACRRRRRSLDARSAHAARRRARGAHEAPRRRGRRVHDDRHGALAGPLRERARPDLPRVHGRRLDAPAPTLGLGVALARPDVPVWILDGDGSLAMQLGSLLTIASAAPRRFLHVVLNNGVYDTSGAQPVPGEGQASFVGLAEAAGYARAE